MYSWEIDEILRNNNFNLESRVYLNVFNNERSPQIKSVLYNGYMDDFEVITTDGYCWRFKVYFTPELKGE